MEEKNLLTDIESQNDNDNSQSHTQHDDTAERDHSAIDPSMLVFHYNREERVKKASKIVQKSYDGTLPKPPQGFFKVLVHTKSSRGIFIVLLLVLVFTVATVIGGSKKHKGTIDGLSCTLSAFSFEDVIYVSVHVTEEGNRSKTADSKTSTAKSSSDTDLAKTYNERHITADFSFINSEGLPLVDQKIEQTFTKNEIFLRTTLSDYDILSVHCLLTIHEKELMLEAKVEKK